MKACHRGFSVAASMFREPLRTACRARLANLWLLICAASVSPAAQAAEDMPRNDDMVRLVRQDCGSCHGMTLQGGLGSPLTRDALAGQSVDALAVIILHGKQGTAMPPWKSLLSETQARWIAERLVAGFPEEQRP